jgi:hypothetical protein
MFLKQSGKDSVIPRIVKVLKCENVEFSPLLSNLKVRQLCTLLIDPTSQEGMAVGNLVNQSFLMREVWAPFCVVIKEPSIHSRTVVLLSNCMYMFIYIEMVYNYPRSERNYRKEKSNIIS